MPVHEQIAEYPAQMYEWTSAYRKTLDNSGDAFKQTAMHCSLLPFVAFVERIQKGFTWRERIYILLHGCLPERLDAK